jgi:hypothetical protein
VSIDERFREIAVLETLRRLIEERLDIAGVEILDELAQRLRIFGVFRLQRGRARGVFLAGLRRVQERGERLVGRRDLLARVLNDFRRFGTAAHHARARARKVDARIHQMLRGLVDRVDLLQGDIGQAADIVMRTRERPEAEPFGHQLKETEHHQYCEQTR